MEYTSKGKLYFFSTPCALLVINYQMFFYRIELAKWFLAFVVFEKRFIIRQDAGTKLGAAAGSFKRSSLENSRLWVDRFLMMNNFST